MNGDNTVFDLDKVFRGDTIVINDYVMIRQPTLNEIVDYGSDKFMEMVHTLCSIPSDTKAFLYDDLHIDYMEISDFEYFGLMSRAYTSKDTYLLFGEDLDFSKMRYAKVTAEDKYYIGIPIYEDDEVMDFVNVMDEETYNIFIKYLRGMFNITPKVEKAGSEMVKRILIKKSRQKRELNKNKKNISLYKSIIITLVNTEEFKYDYKTIYDLTVTQFMASAEQIPHKKYAESLITASMSGFVDTSKVKNKKDIMNWMYIEPSDRNKDVDEKNEDSPEVKLSKKQKLQEEVNKLQEKLNKQKSI